MKRNLSRSAPPQAGVTLTELLVVLVIASILSSIAVPVYINKAENARKATAEVECRQLAEAEDACAMIHGFYVPLQVLNDLPEGASTSANTDTIDRESSIFLVDPALPLTQLRINQPPLTATSFDPRVQEMIKKWQGPFLNPQRVFKLDTNTSSGDPTVSLTAKLRDYPLDPWGQPYRFYSPAGPIGSEDTSLESMRNSGFSNGMIGAGSGIYRYDRYAIVSYGPNRKPNSDDMTNQDDIAYTFGTVRTVQNETNYNP